MHFERSIMFFLHLSGKSDLTRDPSINARGRDLTLLTPFKNKLIFFGRDFLGILVVNILAAWAAGRELEVLGTSTRVLDFSRVLFLVNYLLHPSSNKGCWTR